MSNTKIETGIKNNNCDLDIIKLQKLEQSIDWDTLVEAAYPHYIKSKIKPTSLTVESILRIYVLGRYFDKPPETVEKALVKVDALRKFALIDLDRDVVPNASCISEFMSLLMEQSLAPKIEQALKVNLSNNEYATAV